MSLPYENTLPIKNLSVLFNNISESYKIFWFQAIVEKVLKNETVISYEDLIHTMAANAWYIVLEYKLNLGYCDALEKFIKSAYEKSQLKPTEPKQNIIAFLEKSRDKELIKYKNILTRNVPYRIHSPFLPRDTEINWNSTKSFIEYANRIFQSRQLIYYYQNLNGSNKNIILNKTWLDYFKKNGKIIEEWINYHLILYLQKRNPNVPGIPNKLYPHTERKLDKILSLWKNIIKDNPVYDIYIDKKFTQEHLDKYGLLSMDHFIPWSYVAHDELWNLTPTFRRVNSSKSNKLPTFETYFTKLSVQHYELNQMKNNHAQTRHLFDECVKEHINNEEIMQKLYRNNITYKEFQKNMRDLIYPVYLNAYQSGFELWNLNINLF